MSADQRKNYINQKTSDHFVTPPKVFWLIEKHWGVTLPELFDSCPLHADFDGLKIPWKQYNYVNPPYSLLGEFVAKAWNESDKGKTSFLLLPSYTDAEWFHWFVWPHYENIVWMRGRLRFAGEKKPSMNRHFLVRFPGA